MTIRDVLEQNRLPIEQVILLTEFQRKFINISNVEFLELTGQIGVLSELSVYNSKKMYIAFEMDCRGQVIGYDKNNIAYNEYYIDSTTYVESWIGNLSDDVTVGSTVQENSSYKITNFIFSRVTTPLKFIGLRITLT